MPERTVMHIGAAGEHAKRSTPRIVLAAETNEAGVERDPFVRLAGQDNDPAAEFRVMVLFDFCCLTFAREELVGAVLCEPAYMPVR